MSNLRSLSPCLGVSTKPKHFFRPATHNVLKAALDGDGTPTAWSHRLVGPDGPSFMITLGAEELIYAIPNERNPMSTNPIIFIN